MSVPRGVLQSVCNEIELLCPDRLTGPARQLVADAVDELAKRVPIPDTGTGITIARFAADMIGMGALLERPPEPAVDVEAEVRARCRELVTAVTRLHTGEPVRVGLPGNPFHVGRRHDSVTFDLGGLRTVSTSAALLLGVWLCAVADPTLKDASILLARIATR